jgi:hypothetical protein
MNAEQPRAAFQAGDFGRVSAWIVTIGMGYVALVLWVDPWPYEDPTPPMVPVAAGAIDPTTVRLPERRLHYEVGGFGYRCSECHRLFESSPDTSRELTQHQEIVMVHGIGNRCFNCHHREERDYFVAHDGSTIDSTDPEKLCAKCHGPVFRDWRNRVHGRTNGFWDPARWEQEVQTCTACHDPHAPAFPRMVPAPGPNTLRMPRLAERAPYHHEEDEDQANPLLFWRRRAAREHAQEQQAHQAETGAEKRDEH